MLTIVAVGAQGKVVYWSQMSDELSVRILTNQVAEVFAMVVLAQDRLQ